MAADLSRRLFVTDLDGTLLDDTSQVSDTSRKILSELTARGVGITVATARTPATVQPLLAGTGIHVPAVVMTGAALWDCSKQKYIDAQRLAVDDAIYAGQQCEEWGLSPMVYKMGEDDILHVYHTPSMPPMGKKFIDERSHLALKKTHATENPLGHLLTPDTILILAVGPEEAVMKVRRRLHISRRPLSVAYYTDPNYPGIYFLEIFGPDVTKAQALRRLRDITGATHITVFGDSYNDLSMMAEADLAIAVENAAHEVRAAADIVIGRNTDDAVARYILSQTEIRNS